MPPAANAHRMPQGRSAVPRSSCMRHPDPNKMSEPRASIPAPAPRRADQAAAPATDARANERGMGSGREKPFAWYKDNATAPKLLLAVELFAVEKIQSLGTEYSYHCLEHTASVVRNARLIAETTDMSTEDFELLSI